MGVINAAQNIGMKKPIIIRLKGTNVAEAKKLIEVSIIYAVNRRLCYGNIIYFPNNNFVQFDAITVPSVQCTSVG